MSELFHEHTFRFLPEEIAVFRPPTKLPPSQWAAQHVEIIRGSHQGPWSPLITPHMPQVLDAWALPHVREVDFCAAPQGGGKSTAQHILMLYAADTDPADPMMLILPEKEMAEEVVVDVLGPMIEGSPRLAALKSQHKSDNTKRRLRLINGATIHAAWATSASRLAARSVAKLFYDEVCKFPTRTGGETDPLTLGDVRRRWYPHTYKIFRSSSPTDPLTYWPKVVAAQAVYCWEARCPFCGEHQIMEFKRIKWPKEGPRRIFKERLARYECAACAARWTDHDRDRALDGGRWAPHRWDDEAWDWAPIPEPAEPYHVAFHLPSWCSKQVSLSEVAKDFLQAQGDRIRMAGFVNNHEALPFKDWASQREEEQILALRGPLPRWAVPAEAAVLTAYADVQQAPAGFYGAVMAWGWGLSLTGWLVNEFFVETWEALEAMLFGEVYRGPDGVARPINFGLIDSGWNAEQVYAWCRVHQPFYPAKGRQAMDNFWGVTRLDKFPDGRRIPGGLNLYNLHTTALKDALANKLLINADAPGAIHLHAEASREYARHLCAEYKDEQGRWQCPPRRANHWWDATVGCLAGAKIIHYLFMQEPGAQTGREARPQPAPGRLAGRPGWFGR